MSAALASPIVITIDVDWAPDFMIDHTAGILADRGVCATWFITHASPAIDRLRGRSDLFEIGVHPNFMRGSTHGEEPDDVLRHCLELAPDAVSVRSHSLLQSTPLLDAIAETSLEIDCSVYIQRVRNAQIFEHWTPSRTLTRVPFVWEDDLEARRPDALWDFHEDVRGSGSLVVMNFHPVHVFLNSSRLDEYEQLKRLGARIGDLPIEKCRSLVAGGHGAGTALLGAAEQLSAVGGGHTLSEVVERLPPPRSI